MEFLQIWEVLLRRKWVIVIVFLLVSASVFLGTRLITPTYKADAKLLMYKSNSISPLLSSMGLASESTDDDYQTDIILSTVRPLVQDVIERLDLKGKNDKPLVKEDFVKKTLVSKIIPRPYVTAEVMEETDILNIISTSSDPAQAAQIANTLAELYIQATIDRLMDDYSAAREYIQNEIKKVKHNFYVSMADIMEFSLKHQTVDLDQETQNLLTKITDLTNSCDDNEKTIVELEETIFKAKELLKDREEFRKDAKSFVRNDQVKTLESMIDEFMIDIAGKRIDYQKLHPDYRQVENEMEAARNLLKKKAQVVFSSESYSIDPIVEELSNTIIESYIDKTTAIAKREFFLKYIEKYKDDLMAIPLKTFEYTKLDSSLTVNKDLYLTLSEYQGEISIAESMNFSNIKLVEAAVPPQKKDFPKKIISLVLAVFLGSFLAFAAALFIEATDTSIRSVDEIKSIRTMSYLGTIPAINHLKNRNTISTLEPSSLTVESFRALGNSIKLDAPPKSLVVTSPVNGEGKSSIASNLAVAFAMGNQRVMLVDLCLRKPALHAFFDAVNPGDGGVKSVLENGNTIEKAAIQTHCRGLDLLPCGLVPSDPIALIESMELSRMIETLETLYDVVIIDTPPVTLVNDAVVAAAITGAAITVVRPGRTTMPMIEQSISLMEKAQVGYMGIAANRFREKTSFTNNYFLKRLY